MLYKEDWEQARKRLIAWWNHEIIDRAVICVYAPRKGVSVKHEWNGWSLVKNLNRTDWVIDEFEKHCKGMFFGGEAIPHLFVNLGPGILAGYLGCEVNVAEETVWYHEPGDLSLDDIVNIRFDPQKNEWWQTTMRLMNTIGPRAAGKFFCGITDLNAELNALAALRGNERLLMDCIDAPDKVKKANDHIHDVWHWCYKELVKTLAKYQEGTVFWMNIWCPTASSDLQSDFSAMISPDMFRAFVLDHLKDSARKIDRTIWHLDGPGEVPHLDMILSVPELTGIQWVPGAGKPNTGSPEYFPMYRKIQKAGKNLVLQGMKPEQVEGVMKALDPRGLLIETSCDTQDEAEALIAKVAKWTKGAKGMRG